MDERMSRLLQVAKDTREALYAEWKEKQHFEDYDNFANAGRGILSEAMGLTSVMLLFVCFSEHATVYTPTDLGDTKTILTNTLNYLHEAVFDEGYSIAPLRTAEETAGVIDKERPYVDTLTWVLSAASLTIYAARQRLIELDASLERKAIELIADALAHTLHAQLDNGAWGFSGDRLAKHSLYATYAVAVSLGDFLDYILGELKYYESDENQEKDITDFYDWQTVNAINTYYAEHKNEIYPTVDITEAVAEAKSKLQMWLLQNCLPLIPKIADCTPLSEEEMARIGVSKQTSSESIAKLHGKDYINLYYAYYIIDILTASSADKRYEAIAAGNDAVSLNDLKTSYKKLLSEGDYYYFFEKGNATNAANLLKDYINQAIHSARTNFSTATRSGSLFWDSNASELLIPWEHEEFSTQKIGEARGDVKISEPALVPMALRANTVYCYYIIERADITVDNLFNMVCRDRATKTERIKRTTQIKNLWDSVNYSLPLTERSVEALVDYYDYLSHVSVDESVAEQEAPASVEAAIEQKIGQYLHSEKGQKLLSSMGFVRADEQKKSAPDEGAITAIVEKAVAKAVEEKLKELPTADVTGSAAPAAAFDVDALIGEIENAQRFLNKNLWRVPQGASQIEGEKLANAMMVLQKKLIPVILLDKFSEMTDDAEQTKEVMQRLMAQMLDFADMFVKYSDSGKGNIAQIYENLYLSE